MTHVLAKIRGANPEEIKKVLKSDADRHAQEGLYLEHFWHNTKDNNEVFFLFRSEDIAKAEEFIKRSHTEAYMNDISANLPQMIFLQAVPV
jgi:hypothetical protein